MRREWPEVVQFLEEVDPRWWTVTQPDLFLAVAPEPPTKFCPVVRDDELAPTTCNAGEPELSHPELVSASIDPQHPLNDIMTTASVNEDSTAIAITEPAAVEFDEFKNFDAPTCKDEDEAEPPPSAQDERERQEATNPSAVVPRHVRGPSLAVELGSWEGFLDRHWLDPQGTCQPAPWNERADFISRLNERMQTAVRDTRLAHAYLMGRAVEQLDGTPYSRR